MEPKFSLNISTTSSFLERNCLFQHNVSICLIVVVRFAFLPKGLLFTSNFELRTIPYPRILESCIQIKINLDFYFHISLWCLKMFYEGLKGLHKTF